MPGKLAGLSGITDFYQLRLAETLSQQENKEARVHIDALLTKSPREYNYGKVVLAGSPAISDVVMGGVNLAAAPNYQAVVIGLGLVSALGNVAPQFSMLFAVAGVYLWVVLLIFYRTGSFFFAIRHFILPSGGMTMAMSVLFYLPVVAIMSGITPIVANRFVAGLPYDNFFSQLGPHLITTLQDVTRNVPPVLLLGGGILILVGFATAVKRRLLSALLLLPCLIIGSVAVLFAKHSIPFARTWIFFLLAVFIMIDIGLVSLAAGFRPRFRCAPIFAATLLSAVAAGTLIRNNTIAAYSDTGHFPEAEQVVMSLVPILEKNDKVRVHLPADMPVYYYMRRYGIPNSIHSGKRVSTASEYFIVKKSQYSVQDMTTKKVTRVYDFEDAAVFKSIGE